MALFAYSSTLIPNLDGPLLMAVTVSTIRAANKKVEPVLDLSRMAEGKNPTLAFRSDATLIIMYSNHHAGWYSLYIVH